MVETVLILSGGAALGIYHLGVTKALHQENLLLELYLVPAWGH